MQASAVIFHGCSEKDEYLEPDRPSPSNADWLPWMQKQLCLRGYLCQAPEMPSPYAPDYAAWKAVADTVPIDERALLVAHSCGCGFVLRWLGETGRTVDRLLLVAPWLDLQNRRGAFLDFEPAPDLMSRVRRVTIVHAANDPVREVEETVAVLRATYPAAEVHRLAAGGHLSGADFPPDQFHVLARFLD